jgi:hypothetical protein
MIFPLNTPSKLLEQVKQAMLAETLIRKEKQVL